MASRDDFTVGWICALPLEMAAAKAMLDRTYPDLPPDPTLNDTNAYILGSLMGHNVVVVCLPFGVYGTISAATVATQMLATFKSIRFSLMVGIGGGVPCTREDVRLGDIVVSKPSAARPGIIQYDFGKRCAGNHFTSTGALNKPSTLLLTAAGKVETCAILGESKIHCHISQLVARDPRLFARPDPDEDILYDGQYDHPPQHDQDGECHGCDVSKIVRRATRDHQNPKVHYGLVASGNQVMRHGATRDKLAKEHGIICFEMEAAGLMDITQCLVIRGICDYADTHKSKRWQGYAAAAAAAYAKELLSLTPKAPKPDHSASVSDTIVAMVLDALLVTRPEVDRSSLIALKGRRVDGTCEWLIRHPSYQTWLHRDRVEPPLLWVSGGPGKGKTMLAIFITEQLQHMVKQDPGVLLYYFCSNRDKKRNTALTIMRGILHQWISQVPGLATHVRSYFEGDETTKYTTSSFICLWRLFRILLSHCNVPRVYLVLDGLDECEEESLQQLLDVLGDYLLESNPERSKSLSCILLSRPQSGPLETYLRPFRRIRLDDSETEIGQDVVKYITAKVAELASEQNLSQEKLDEVHRTLLASADGTFLWVGFVANELKGKRWLRVKEILQGIPKGLGGIYCRLLEQVEEKESLVPILRWIVLAARPLTLDELAFAAKVQATDSSSPKEVLKDRLASCGLLVRVEEDLVNLVHESAREYFQSEQIKADNIKMFHMDQAAHRTLMRTCLGLIEDNYRSPGSISNASLHNTLLTYASLYWPEHFRHAVSSADFYFEPSRRFFQQDSAVRDDWWNFYWQQEQAGGAPPSFSLLHLAAYFGNLPWAQLLLRQDASDGLSFRRFVSTKDTYGRTPLFWAATRGHRDIVELLLDHGANINSKDRGKMTALHIAVTGEHKEVVTLLLDRSARLEERAYYGDTALMRAIQAPSKDLVRLLLERGARVDGLPRPIGSARLKSHKAPLQERVKELLDLREQIFAAQYEQQSKRVDMAIKMFTYSLRIKPVFSVLSMYMSHASLGRWEVLQDLVKNNESARLREWAQSWIKFGRQLIDARNAKSLDAMTALSVRVFQVVSSADLEALLVIGVLVGSGVMLLSAQAHWRDGVEIAGRTFSHFATLAYQRGAEESLDYGVRQFLIDFDECLRGGRKQESVARVVVLFSTHLAILAAQDPQPIQYFSTVIREYFEGHIGDSHEEDLFNAANEACASELSTISTRKDPARLSLVLAALFQIAHNSRERGQDWLLNVPPVSCQILCQQDPSSHGWLMSQGIPIAMSLFTSRIMSGPTQKRALKALTECLIIGKQYGFTPSAETQQTLQVNLDKVEGAANMLEKMFMDC